MSKTPPGKGPPVLAPLPPAPVTPLAAPPSFSVVIPAYQAVETLPGAVRSVLSQSPPPLELIVVDDGSRDDVGAVLAAFGDAVRLIRRPHQGVAAARNAGWRSCSGDFVLVVDADDVLLPGKLAALGSLGRARPDLDLLCTDMYFEVEGRRSGRFGDANPFPIRDQRIAILESCFAVQPAIRRASLEMVGGFDESLSTAEDWDCVLRLLLAGSAAGLHDEPLAVYRIHRGSLTDSRARTMWDRVRMMEKAGENPALRSDERRVLTRVLAAQRSRATLAEAQAAVSEGREDARRRGLELARSGGASLRDRVWGLAVFAAPSGLRHRLARSAAARSQLSRELPARRAADGSGDP